MTGTLKQLKAFVAVAEARSFVEAQDVAHLSQPALSVSIKNLEDSVGGKLLSRSTRSISLTPEGREFLPTAKRLVQDWSDSFEDLARLFAKQRGRLTMAAIPSYAANQLSKPLTDFHRRHPNVDLSIQDVVAEQVVEMVRIGRVDFGVTFKVEDDGELFFQPLFRDKFVVAVPRDHALSDKKRIRWSALNDVPVVLLQSPSKIRREIDAIVQTKGQQLSIIAESHQLATLGQMVASGLGVSIVPSLSSSQMSQLGVSCKPLIDPEIVRYAGIVRRKRYPLSSVAQEMITTLEKHHRRDIAALGPRFSHTKSA